MLNKVKVKPTPRQLAYQDWEWGLFLHFGIRTYYEGHVDFDGKVMPAERFNPTQLDCEQWIRTAKEAGMKYTVLTAKHHDGFAIWPTKYSDYSVAHIPWKDGQGDVVRDYVDACRACDMKVGLYYSPMEVEKSKITMDYDDYFIAQIGELLTGYGQIDLIWFDGCGSENHQYDWGRIIAEIKAMQPDILIFNMGEPDIRWTGNEQGYVTLPNWNESDRVPFSIKTDADDYLEKNGGMWLPVECDCRMREENWFYSDRDVETVKSLEELMSIYYYSVGRGANLLLNIGPNREGLLPEEDSKRLIEFGNEVRRRFHEGLLSIDDFQQEENTWHCTLDEPITMNHAMLQEDLSQGENVRAYEISIIPYPEGRPITIHSGSSMGHKAICQFPVITTKEIRLIIKAWDEKPVMKEIGFYGI